MSFLKTSNGTCTAHRTSSHFHFISIVITICIVCLHYAVYTNEEFIRISFTQEYSTRTAKTHIFFLGIYLNLPFANINPRKCRFKCFDLMKSKLEDYTVNASSARFNSSENTVAAN